MICEGDIPLAGQINVEYVDEVREIIWKFLIMYIDSVAGLHKFC